jgi:hypothetical protein
MGLSHKGNGRVESNFGSSSLVAAILIDSASECKLYKTGIFGGIDVQLPGDGQSDGGVVVSGASGSLGVPRNRELLQANMLVTSKLSVMSYVIMRGAKSRE